MTKPIAAIVVCLSLLTMACTSQQDYLNSLNRFNGMRETALIEKFGPPDRVYELEGRKYLSFVSRTEQSSPDTSFYGGTYGGGVGLGTGIGTGTGSRYRISECENTFVIFNGVVERSGYKGQCY